MNESPVPSVRDGVGGGALVFDYGYKTYGLMQALTKRRPALFSRPSRSTWPVSRLKMPPNQPKPSQIELLRAAYAGFNERDIDAALATMTPDVAWPRAFKGGFVQGPEAVRAYWTEQWSEINPRVEPVALHSGEDGCILVEVHQVVCDLAGAVMADEYVGHRFTLDQGLIQKMEVCSVPASVLGA